MNPGGSPVSPRGLTYQAALRRLQNKARLARLQRAQAKRRAKAAAGGAA